MKEDIYKYIMTREEFDEFFDILENEEYVKNQMDRIQNIIQRIIDRWYDKGYKDGYENCIKDSTQYE